MTELIKTVARAWNAYEGKVSTVFDAFRKHEEMAFTAGYKAALTAITDAGYRIVKDERGQDQRCPSCGVKFREIANVDAHISALPAAPGDEK